jgi:hypothetical protein
MNTDTIPIQETYQEGKGTENLRFSVFIDKNVTNYQLFVDSVNSQP